MKSNCFPFIYGVLLAITLLTSCKSVKNHFSSAFPGLEASPSLDTLSYYSSLDDCLHISSLDYPQQTARMIIDRPAVIKKVVLYLDGPEKGVFTVRFFGHESGTNYPALSNDLIPPVKKRKRKKGYEAIVLKPEYPLIVTNDQFYISLENFSGDFGLCQDASFYREYCLSENGGNYYPTILKTTNNRLIGENCYTAIDVVMEMVSDRDTIFRNITHSVGIPGGLTNDHIAWGDYNDDGWPDLIVAGKIFRNNKGIFEEKTSEIADTIPHRVRAGAFADINNDGYLDILLLGTYKSRLYINRHNGNFTGHNLAIPPLPSLHAFSIADINRDRFPDLVLAQLWEPYPVPQPNYLFLNDGENNFIDITRRLYPGYDGRNNFPKGYPCISEVDSTYFPDGNRNRRSRGTQFTDFDLDGDTDLYITNYFLEKDEFYENDGSGFFSGISPPKPLFQSDTMNNHGTGVDWYDYDNDVDFDLLLPQLAHPRYIADYDHRGTTIFRNEGGEFTDLRTSHGIEYEETHAGATFGDVNNDGLADILTTVYYGCRFIDLYLQRKDNTFRLSTYRSGLSRLTTGNDACFIDFNNDGLLDLAVGEKDRFRLFKNIHTTKNNWLKLEVRSSSFNSFGIGTIVKVYAGGQVFSQEVNAGRGQKMQKPYMLHFGLGENDKIEKVEVIWAQDKKDLFFNCKVNQTYYLHEGGQMRSVVYE